MIHYYAAPGIKSPISYKYDNDSIQIQVDMIFDIICKYFGFKREDICSRSRKRELIVPRQILIWFLKNKCKLTLTKIGEIFGLDHTTVIHSCKRVELIMDESLNYPEKMHFDKLYKLI